MSADVNVTEKVAQAIDPAIYPHINHLTGDAWAASKRAATAALAVLSDPEVLDGMAGVLREHGLTSAVLTSNGSRAASDLRAACLCGLVYPARTYKPIIPLHADHQAAALAEWLRGQG